MRIHGPKSYAEVLRVFGEENKHKDSWYDGPEKDSWPRGRFAEANAQFNEQWCECELTPADVLRVKLPWNNEFEIPKEGMLVEAALKLSRVKTWIDEGSYAIYPHNTHVVLASRVLVNTSSVEQQFMRDHDGYLIHLDGLHRLLAWAHLKFNVLAFLAGPPPETTET